MFDGTSESCSNRGSSLLTNCFNKLSGGPCEYLSADDFSKICLLILDGFCVSGSGSQRDYHNRIDSDHQLITHLLLESEGKPDPESRYLPIFLNRT